jgi:hypothetical protein
LEAQRRQERFPFPWGQLAGGAVGLAENFARAGEWGAKRLIGARDFLMDSIGSGENTPFPVEVSPVKDLPREGLLEILSDAYKIAADSAAELRQNLSN